MHLCGDGSGDGSGDGWVGVGVGMGGCVCIIVHVCLAVHMQVASFLLRVYGVSNCVQERAILAESKVTKLKKTVQSLQVSLLGISTWCVCMWVWVCEWVGVRVCGCVSGWVGVGVGVGGWVGGCAWVWV